MKVIFSLLVIFVVHCQSNSKFKIFNSSVLFGKLTKSMCDDKINTIKDLNIKNINKVNFHDHATL